MTEKPQKDALYSEGGNYEDFDDLEMDLDDLSSESLETADIDLNDLDATLVEDGAQEDDLEPEENWDEYGDDADAGP